MRSPNRHEIGRQAEQRALRFLEGKGLVLLARNARSRRGEIDLVMKEGDEVVFVEVRYRSRRDFGSSLDSVTPEKCRRLLRAARDYIARYRITAPCRIDVLAMDGPERTEWLIDAVQQA